MRNRKEKKSNLPALPELQWPARLLLYLAFLVLAAAAIYQAAYGILPEMAGGAVYAGAAVLLICAGVYLYRDIRAGVRKVTAKIEANALTRRLYRDYGYRTVFTTFLSTGINTAYMVYNGIFGILTHSVWFVTMAVYYCLLGGMRLLSVNSKRKADKMEDREAARDKELLVLKRDGILLFLMTAALSGMIFFTISENMDRSHSEIHAIAIAAYTFYKIIISGVNMRKAGKMDSPVLKAIRNIGFADALVSMISLQTVMLSSFQSEGKGEFAVIMNSSVGFAVCLIIVFMGIQMIYLSEKRK